MTTHTIPPSEAAILLLDSDSAVRSVLSDALQRAGYLVTAAEDLGAAVDRLNEMRYHLLIVRPYISSMTGRMAADYLRGKHPGLRVLILGGFMDDDQESIENEIEEFHTFPKPFTRAELVDEVRNVLNVIRKQP